MCSETRILFLLGNAHLVKALLLVQNQLMLVLSFRFVCFDTLFTVLNIIMMGLPHFRNFIYKRRKKINILRVDKLFRQRNLISQNAEMPATVKLSFSPLLFNFKLVIKHLSYYFK